MAQAIGLGESCAIRVEGAKYSLEVPINNYLFGVLRCFQEMTRLVEESVEFPELGDGFIHRVNRFNRPLSEEEMALFKLAAELPPLVNSKEVVRRWVDEAIMPFILIQECGGKKDLEKLLAVPKFAEFLRNRKGISSYSDARRAIRNAILQQLPGLAHHA